MGLWLAAVCVVHSEVLSSMKTREQERHRCIYPRIMKTNTVHLREGVEVNKITYVLEIN
jgi:hypothetical protein